jgi:hypothetical protein
MRTATNVKRLTAELETLIESGWKFDFRAGEWTFTRPLDRSVIWFGPHPSTEITETMLGLACGEICHSCLKASTSHGRRVCFRCWANGREQHRLIAAIAFEDCEI